MKKVLIIDDDEEFLESLVDGLMNFNDPYKLYTAKSAQEAIELLKRENFDLIITDLKMPGMDGAELIAKLLNSGCWIPIIAISAYGTPSKWQELEQLGIVDYLEKPIQLQELRLKILETLKKTFKDRIKNMGLPSVLQILALEKKTAILNIKDRATGVSGEIFVKQGDVIDAVSSDGKRGKEAFFHLLKFSKPYIELRYIDHNRKQTIRPGNLQQLLLEFASMEGEETAEILDMHDKEIATKELPNISDEFREVYAKLYSHTDDIQYISVYHMKRDKIIFEFNRKCEKCQLINKTIGRMFLFGLKAYKDGMLGKIKDVLLDGEDFSIVIARIGESACIQIVVFSRNISAGYVMAMLKKIEKEVESVIARRK